jgi:glycerol-3-phosphate acyltransferase PlsX
MRIAVDAMGGDNAPVPEVAGAVKACQELKGIKEIVLVGNPEIIKKELLLHQINGLPISIERSESVIGMHESPAAAVKAKKDSSIVISTKLIKEGRVNALVSAGNTGAVMASSLMHLGRVKGVLRPALAIPIPTLTGHAILLDVGANVDCKPQHLLQFAIMGDAYARHIFGQTNPRVGLLSVGEEEGKGNELTSNALELLKKSSPLNFIGNVEGGDIINGRADVVVCDGFVGNVVIKFAESLVEMIIHFLKRELASSLLLKLGAYLARPAFRKFKQTLDYSEFGGAPLLGVNGVSIICHGISSPKAIMNGIRVAMEFINHQVNKHIEEELERDKLRWQIQEP